MKRRKYRQTKDATQISDHLMEIEDKIKLAHVPEVFIQHLKVPAKVNMDNQSSRQRLAGTNQNTARMLTSTKR